MCRWIVKPGNVKYALVVTLLLRPLPPVCAQGIYNTYDGFVVPTQAVLPPVEVHPSLWFRSGETAAIRSRKDSSAHAMSLWNTIMADVGTYRSKSAASQDVSNRPRMAKYMAFAWIVNGDTVARQKALEALLIAYDNVPRTATSSSFDKPYDEIYRGTWLQNYCAAYDWMQPVLSRSQDSTIRAKLVVEIRLLHENMITGVQYASRPHNHRSKPAYGIGTGALTLQADPRASDWLRFALEMQNTVTRYQFSADGLYREGVHYNVYSLVNALPFLWHYYNVSGVDLFAAYQPMFEYPVRARDGRGWLPNIEDGYVKPYPTHMAARAYRTTPTALHPTEPLARVLQWNWFSTSFITADYTGATNDVTWELDEYLTFDGKIAQTAPDFPQTHRMHNGQVVFRDNVTAATPPSRYLLFHGVAECDNHQHPDLLSYVLEYQNTILATDAGYGKDGSSDALRAWYTAPKSHNALSVGGTTPLDWAPNVRPTDTHFLSTAAVDFAEKRAVTAVPGGTVRRGIIFPGKKYWVVYDIATAPTPSEHKLFVHGRGAMMRTGSTVQWTTSTDAYGAAQRLHCALFSDSPFTVSDSTGYTSLFKDQVSQSYVAAQQTGDTVLFMHVLFPGPPTSPPPGTLSTSGNNVASFILAEGSTDSSLFMVQRNRFPRTTGKLTSDATAAWVRFAPVAASRALLVEATGWQWQGHFRGQTSVPVTMAMEFQVSPAVHRYTIDSLSSPATFTDWIPGVVAVTLDGASVPFTKNPDGSVTVTVATRGVLRISADPADALEPETRAHPVGITLDPVYPNPFNPTTVVSCHLPAASQLKLAVYDIMGREVTILANGKYQPGYHRFVLNAAGLPGGMYVFVLRTDHTTVVRKGVLIK